MERKRIAVNTRLLIKNKLEGIGWFSYETLKRITQNHPEIDFIFFFDRPFSEEFIFGENVTGVILKPQARHPILFKIWFDHSVKRALKKYKADLFLSPDGYLSLTTKTPSVAVIHDLNFEHYPEDLPKHITRYYKKYFPKFAKKADRIATVSNYSKSDICNQYQIQEDQIDVVYNGVNTSFKASTAEEKKKTREQYTFGYPYFVYIGSLHKRKNIDRLFQAFSIFKKESDSDLKLVVIGEPMWSGSAWESTYHASEFKKDIIFTGRLSDTELHSVLGAAFALIYVPYFEGFGIPILEAFACEIPVLTSNVTSMPEVADDAAILVNPFEVNEIKDGMLTLFQSEEKRKILVEKGKERLTHFSWDQSADKLWNCIEKVLYPHA